MIDFHAHFVPGSALGEVTAATGPPSYDPDSRTVALPSGPSRPVSPGLSDLAGRRRWMAGRGIDLQVLSPWTDLIGDDLDGPTALRWARLLNDAAADEVGAAGDLRLLAMLPAQPEDAAGELERCLGLPGFVGGALPTQYAGVDLDTAGLDEVFATAVRLGVPLFVHPGRVMAAERMASFFLNNICGYPFETTLAALRLYFSGTFDRHPDLKLLLSHCGGTLPMLAGRAAHTVGRVPAVPGSSAAPDDILDCFLYDTVVHDPAVLGFSVHRLGVERLVIGTDVPFPMSVDQPFAHLSAALESWPADAGAPPAVSDFDVTARRLLGG